MGATEITAEPGVPFIDIRREFAAPRDLLFRAHTDPDLVVQWMGPADYTMVIDEYDVRDGGRWRFINRDDAGNELGFHGVFHGTPTPDSMVQTFEFEGAPGHVSLDALRMEAVGERTRVHVHSVFQSVAARDAMIAGGMNEGVNAGYRRLDELLARLIPVA